MSRIGRAPIAVPAGVTITFGADNLVTVKGPKGELSRQLPTDMQIEQSDGQLVVKRPSEVKKHKALHGLTRTLLSNMVTGVTNGFEKGLEVVGVGYRVQKQDTKLVLQLGFSHPVEIVPPAGVAVGTVETFTPTTANQWLSARFTLQGIDKERVGQLAADIRRLRPAEPYKGKGIRYVGEIVRRKAGKAGKAGKK
ncbi:MAG: 50S ribosomal protein L6 [Chloroflexi bacterium]|nr:50S ribosomal protein L6 [Chloroflexota bacterium]